MFYLEAGRHINPVTATSGDLSRVAWHPEVIASLIAGCTGE